MYNRAIVIVIVIVIIIVIVIGNVPHNRIWN